MNGREILSDFRSIVLKSIAATVFISKIKFLDVVDCRRVLRVHWL